MNGVNLNQFQFEFDLTWMAFFQNAEGQTYARYGGREDAGPETHLTKDSLLRIMQQVLDLHKVGDAKPWSRYEPAGGTKSTPESIPTMKGMMSKRKESCIHCHDVKVASLRYLRERDLLKKDMVFTYPSPSNLGIQIDPDQQDLIVKVASDSAAAAAGLRPNDIIQTASDQRILTFADFTRVLELAPESGTLPLVVRRNSSKKTLNIPLKPGWKKSKDPSWRASTGTVGPGAGFWGIPLTAGQRRNKGIGDDAVGIRVNFIWAKHAKAAGIKNNDVVIALDGSRKKMTMRQAHAHLQMGRNWGDSVEMVVRRGKKDVTLTIKLPDSPPEE